MFFHTLARTEFAIEVEEMWSLTEELIFRIVFWLLVVLLLLIRGISVLKVRKEGERFMPDKKAVEREGKTIYTIRVVSFVSLLAFLVFYSVYPPLPWIEMLSIPLPTWLRWTGSIGGLASLTLWAWAQMSLGKEWSPQLQLRRKHRLVTVGPYKRIRHPIYTAMLGWGISVAVLTANWFFVFLAVFMIAFLMRRAPIEEKMMIEEFGEEYREYMRSTGRFFPKIHRYAERTE